MPITLENKEQTQLNGTVSVDGEIVVLLNAAIASHTATTSSYSEAITDIDLYEANKESCRAQIAKFKEQVRSREDELYEHYSN